MITCKQDLINTYIENDHGELRDLYVKNAVKLGFRLDWLSHSPDGPLNKIVATCHWNGEECAFTGQTSYLPISTVDMSSLRKLTISDLKPRTKVGYEKVTESIFDLKDDFESGILFTKKFNQEWHQIKTEEQLGNLLSMNDDPTKNGIYRKVERSVEWWEDAVEYIRSLNGEANAIDFTDADGDGKKMAMNISVVLDERQAKDFARILLEQECE